MNNFFKEKGLLALKGFCMGSADVVPGVSGGTMAFILGIYQPLIDAIKSFNTEWLKSILRFDIKRIYGLPHFGFLVPVFAGIFAALLFFTRVVPIPSLLKTHPELIYGLFFGLISGSIVVLLRDITNITVKNYLFLFIGVVVGLIVFNLVPTETPGTTWFIFISGALAICAMILPGISGSFVLLILNKYTYVFNAIGYFKFSILVPFGLGCITGLVLFSRFLSYLLHRYYRATIMSITGILIASLWVIWPFQERVYAFVGRSEKLIASNPVLPQWDTSALSSFAMMLLGIVIVLAINVYANRKQLVDD